MPANWSFCFEFDFAVWIGVIVVLVHVNCDLVWNCIVRFSFWRINWLSIFVSLRSLLGTGRLQACDCHQRHEVDSSWRCTKSICLSSTNISIKNTLPKMFCVPDLQSRKGDGGRQMGRGESLLLLWSLLLHASLCKRVFALWWVLCLWLLSWITYSTETEY